MVANKKTVINQGDSLEFDFYIVGYGRSPSFSKIYVNYPISLVDDNTIFGSSTSIDLVIFDDNSTDLRENTTQLTYGKENHFGIIIPEFYYSYFTPNDDGECHMLASTRWYNKSNIPISPFSVTINTSNKASPGNNKIDIIYIYVDGNKTFQDRQEIEYYINSFWEEFYTPLLISTGVLIALLGAILRDFIKNIFNKKVGEIIEKSKWKK